MNDSAKTPESTRLRVLIVDDEWLDLEGLHAQMPVSMFPGMVCDMAGNGFEALDSFATQPYDIVFSDIRMPGMTGLELASEIRNRWPTTAIVFVSGFDEFEYARKAIEVAATYYLLKPVEDEDLARALDLAVTSVRNASAGAGFPPPTSDRTTREISSSADGRAFVPVSRGIAARVADRVAAIVADRLGEDLTLKDLANELQYTSNHLGRLFQDARGVRFGEYLRTQRMERARTLLISHPEMRVSEVADLVGYHDPDAFSRQFQATFGVLPKSFRDAARE